MKSPNTDPARLIRDARRAAGLTQQGLAMRMHTTQSAVAQLEKPGSNPRVETLERALRACGRQLSLTLRAKKVGVDETLVAEMLRIPPEHRLRHFAHAYVGVREVALAGARARGELA